MEAKTEDTGSRFPPTFVKGLGGHRCQRPLNARSRRVPPAAPCTLLTLNRQGDERRRRFLHRPQLPAYCRTATAPAVKASAPRTYRPLGSQNYQLPFMQMCPYIKCKSSV